MASQHEFMATNRFAAGCGIWRHCSSYGDLQKAVESASGCTWGFQVLRSPLDMPVLAAICLTVKRRSSITTCSTRTIMSSDWLVHGRGSFGLFSHDVRPSLNCHTHERTFFTSITLSLHVSLNCRWISIGFMPRKWRNRIITRCSSNVKVAISVSKTLLQLDLVTSIQRVVQCCHLASPHLKNSHVSFNNFHVSICFHSPRKKIRRPYNLNAPRMSPW